VSFLKCCSCEVDFDIIGQCTHVLRPVLFYFPLLYLTYVISSHSFSSVIYCVRYTMEQVFMYDMYEKWFSKTGKENILA